MDGGKVTIPPGIKDPNYRYKMPKMQPTQESRLNGVKTNIFNMEDVAASLRVPTEAIMKFLCSELGANKEGKTIIKGKHTYDMLLQHLSKFIKKYVVCPNCNYPELKHFVEGKGDLKSVCNSCGKTHSHDSTHKAGRTLV